MPYIFHRYSLRIGPVHIYSVQRIRSYGDGMMLMIFCSVFYFFLLMAIMTVRDGGGVAVVVDDDDDDGDGDDNDDNEDDNNAEGFRLMLLQGAEKRQFPISLLLSCASDGTLSHGSNQPRFPAACLPL